MINKKIGLLFGSFDPIHLGHLTIAHWALDDGGCDGVWFVLSPQNPMKAKSPAPYAHRVAMIEIAIEGMKGVELCRVEEGMTSPFYTISTIEKLREDFPNYDFVILCGTDVVEQSSRWHRAEELHAMVEFSEYPRHSEGGLPFVDVSSTELRAGEKLDLLHERVREYMEVNNLYCPHLERGQLRYKEGDIAAALNEWRQCTTEPHLSKARALMELSNSILDYRYTELYNP